MFSCRERVEGGRQDKGTRDIGGTSSKHSTDTHQSSSTPHTHIHAQLNDSPRCLPPSRPRPSWSCRRAGLRRRQAWACGPIGSWHGTCHLQGGGCSDEDLCSWRHTWSTSHITVLTCRGLGPVKALQPCCVVSPLGLAEPHVAQDHQVIPHIARQALEFFYALGDTRCLLLHHLPVSLPATTHGDCSG